VTEFLEFLFSTGGLISAVIVLLLWVRFREQSTAARRCLVLVVAAYAAASIYPISHATGGILTFSFHPFVAADRPPGPTAIVLLGSGSFTARNWDAGAENSDDDTSIPDRSGAARIVEAARVYRLIKPDWVISSGGNAYADDDNVASGDTMRDMLVHLGVPAEKILVETESKNTHDEAVIIRSMLKSISVGQVVLVTTDLHMRRSLGVFRAQGIHPVPAIARRPTSRPPWNLSWIPSEAGIAEAGSVAHEFLGIAYYTLRGWYRFA
jgi:uncharacterized SAM-binding protein YcdF (DUF218 family)